MTNEIFSKSKFKTFGLIAGVSVQPQLRPLVQAPPRLALRTKKMRKMIWQSINLNYSIINEKWKF